MPKRRGSAKVTVGSDLSCRGSQEKITRPNERVLQPRARPDLSERLSDWGV